MLTLARRAVLALARALPQFSPEDCIWATGVVGTFVAGLWPIANPSPLVDRVLSRPEFAPLKSSAERDLERMMLTLLKGLAARAPTGSSAPAQE